MRDRLLYLHPYLNLFANVEFRGDAELWTVDTLLFNEASAAQDSRHGPTDTSTVGAKGTLRSVPSMHIAVGAGPNHELDLNPTIVLQSTDYTVALADGVDGSLPLRRKLLEESPKNLEGNDLGALDVDGCGLIREAEVSEEPIFHLGVFVKGLAVHYVLYSFVGEGLG